MYNLSPKTLFVGRKVIYLPSCHSTNDYAADLLRVTAVLEGTLVVTDHQTAGRGQRGNGWEAAPGQNLTASLVLRPGFLAAADRTDFAAMTHAVVRGSAMASFCVEKFGPERLLNLTADEIAAREAQFASLVKVG